MDKSVKNKTASFTSIRLSPELCKRIDTLRDEFAFRVSRASFTETLIDRGIAVTEKLVASQLGDTGESSFKK